MNKNTYKLIKRLLFSKYNSRLLLWQNLLIVIFKRIIAKFQKVDDNQHLFSTLFTRLSGQYFLVDYGRYQINMRAEDLYQGLNDYHRENHIPFAEYIKPNDTVIDIGAHIGTTAIKMAEITTSGKVIAIEPEMENYALLCLNVNRYQANLKITPLRYAIANNDNYVELTFGELSMYHSMARHHGEMKQMTQKSIRTRSLSLNTLIDKYADGKVSFVKLDVEGAEELILLADESVTVFENNKIKYLYVDHHSGVNYNKIIKHLARFNYSYTNIENCFLFYINE